MLAKLCITAMGRMILNSRLMTFLASFLVNTPVLSAAKPIPAIIYSITTCSAMVLRFSKNKNQALFCAEISKDNAKANMPVNKKVTSE